MRAQYELAPNKMEELLSLFKRRTMGRPSKLGDQNFIRAIKFWAHNGGQWRDLPAEFGPWKTIYSRFRYWSKEDWFAEACSIISQSSVAEGSVIDGSIVRCHQDSCGGKDGLKLNCIGKSAGGTSTKIHAITNERGLPIALALTQGQVHDAALIDKLLPFIKGKYLIADKGYDSDEFIAGLEQRGIEHVIACKSNRTILRKPNPDLYPKRYVVECYFFNIKRYRRIATRYEKTARNYFGLLLFVSMILWLG